MRIIGPNQLHFDRQPVTDFDDLVSRYGGKEFKSPMRSTVPLLALLRDGWPRLQEVLTACHLPAESNLHFEYTVDSPLGVGIPSHTDVMVRSGDDQLALECKWTEPRYETVSKWILKPPDPNNRRKRLMGWLELLQPHATCNLHVDAFSDTVYQMVHRAASACATAPQPSLAYLIFGEHEKSSNDAGKKDFYCIDRLGKTIVFAKNQAHAEFIAQRFDVNYPHYKGAFARVIHHGVPYAQSLIDDFSNPSKPPHIAISVDMLDTGIDIPEVVNLVFIKLVRSKTKFWQMVG